MSSKLISSPDGVVVVAFVDSLDGMNVYAIEAARRKRVRRLNSCSTSRLLNERSFPWDMDGVNTVRRTDNQDVRPPDKKTGLNDTGNEV